MTSTKAESGTEKFVNLEHWTDVVDRYEGRFGLPPMAPHLLEPHDIAQVVKHMRRALRSGQPVAAHILERYSIPDGAKS